MITKNMGRVVTKMMADYFYEDDFTIKSLAYSYSQIVYHIETPDKNMVLRFPQGYHLMYWNLKALQLLSGKGIAPEIIIADEHMKYDRLFFSFEEFLPGTLFPYKEKDKREKVIPVIAKHYAKIMAVKPPKEVLEQYERKGYQDRICSTYFEWVPKVFGERVGDNSLKQYMKDHLPEPSRLCLIQGKFGFDNCLFHDGKVSFFDFTRGYFAEPEMDWGYMYAKQDLTKNSLEVVAKMLKLDISKIYYYAMLHSMKRYCWSQHKKTRDKSRQIFFETKKKFEEWTK